jgi:chromosome segregation protein
MNLHSGECNDYLAIGGWLLAFSFWLLANASFANAWRSQPPIANSQLPIANLLITIPPFLYPKQARISIFAPRMRLQSLTIKGFKSFANETVINFNEDVIGVVGPNGAGKSNVVDAIRWVLGEQKSKELRLESMTNVIFNGTKKRKPGGIAQVSLTFENTKNILPTEYNIVTISRLLYRTGESEYRLNNVPCRLKDIHSLLLDTGIGSNSYAIIALGMVDDILQDKNDARRRMFEQASGISKYKKRKHETLNQLKNTAEDLDRIDDLLFEIEGQLKALEKQAKRARKFYEIKGEYKTFSIDLANHKLKGYKVTHTDLKSKIEEEEDHYRQLEVDAHKLEAKLEQDKKLNLDKEKELSNRQREVNELVGRIRNLENDKKILEQKNNFIAQNKVKLSEQIKSYEDRIQQLQISIENISEHLQEDKRREGILEDELNREEIKLKQIQDSHSNLKDELDEYIQSQQILERAVFELEKTKAINLSQIERFEKEAKESELALFSKSSEVKELETALNTIVAAMHKSEQHLRQLEEEEAKRQSDITFTEGNMESLRKTIGDVNRKLDAKRNEYKLTKSLVENLEGFPESIKFLSQNKQWKDTDVPLLSDILYCKEEYRIAIENYLGAYLNYYVVDTIDDAYKAIQLLSNAQKGKANFFILDAFKDFDAQNFLIPGTQHATEYIETEPLYRKLVSYLLEGVLMTDSDEVNRNISHKDVVLLSKSGKMVQRKFSLSGGSVGLFEGKKIGRKKNLEILETEIADFEKQETKLSGQFYGLRTQLEQLKAKVNNSAITQERELFNKQAQEKVSLMTRLENIESILRESNKKKSAAAAEVAELLKSNEYLDGEFFTRQAQVDEAKNNISEKDNSFRQIAEELGAASAAYNAKNIEFIRQQNKVNALQRELSFHERQLEESKHNLENNQRTIEQESQEQINIEKNIKEMDDNLIQLYQEKEGKAAELTKAEESYFSARGDINQIDDSLRSMNKKRNDAQQLIQSLKDRYNEFKLDLASIGERLRIEFNITVEEVMAKELETEIPVEELQDKVDKLKSRLDNYGEINPMAMEAYDEMKQRYDSINTQRQDILTAKASLLDTIKEIETTATAQFMSSFNKVREYFIDAFRTLFTEDDDCDLVLDDPDNPLESTITITAKPKGKRPVSISQLSGGEKTLTATALLFALYLLKPAPFCIFDEVDAPLDDANIEKFNKIIRRFSKDSQFIIVTHNKQTMAAVDVIYGVYMPEQGVSSVSAVDFRELDHTVTLELA